MLNYHAFIWFDLIKKYTKVYWGHSDFELARNCKERFLHLWKYLNLILDVVTKAKLESLNSIIHFSIFISLCTGVHSSKCAMILYPCLQLITNNPPDGYIAVTLLLGSMAYIERTLQGFRIVSLIYVNVFKVLLTMEIHSVSYTSLHWCQRTCY